MATGPRDDSDDPTRARLVAAAAAVFAEKGYDRAGVQAIARRAGFSTGVVYGRFRGKAELLGAAIGARSNEGLDRLVAGHAPGGAASDLLRTAGSRLVTEQLDDGRALLLEALVAARREPDVASLLRAAIDSRAGRLAAVVDAAKEAGDLDAELDTPSIVWFCHALGLGCLVLGALDLPRPGAEPWEALVTRLVGAASGRGGREEPG